MSTLKNSWAVSGMLGLLAATTVVAMNQPAIAQTTAEMIATAEKSCLDSAAAKGYNTQLSNVVSSESIDADTVRVVLNLTKDGNAFDRLTCPYSVSKGLAAFDDAAAAVGDAVARPRFPWWWLLLPLIGLPLLFLWGRGRQEPTTVVRGASDHAVRYTDGYVNTYGNALSVHERADGMSHVLRTIPDGTHVSLSGRREDFWVELKEGGWVDSRSLRFSDGVHRA